MKICKNNYILTAGFDTTVKRRRMVQKLLQADGQNETGLHTTYDAIPNQP